MRDITEKQLQVLRYLSAFTRRHGYPPTIRELGTHFRITSLRGVTVHLDSLERKGFIRRAASARAIAITPAGKALVGGCPEATTAAPLDAVLDGLRRERDRHFALADQTDPEAPNGRGVIKRLRYTAGILETIAAQIETEYTPDTEDNAA